MKLTCQHARPLVPSYLDGELSREQAAPLREHLFDCRACRELAKDGKALRRWFVDAEAASLVPAGFAARVARRAFAGDPGSLEPALPPARPRGELLPFLLKACTVAAGLLLVLAVSIQRRELPGGDDLRAEPLPPWERAEALPAGVPARPRAPEPGVGSPAEEEPDAPQEERETAPTSTPESTPRR